AEHELVEAVVGIALHDVPEERAPAHLDHRLGTKLRLLAHAGALTAAEQDDFGLHAAVNRPPANRLERGTVQGLAPARCLTDLTDQERLHTCDGAGSGTQGVPDPAVESRSAARM